MAWSEIEGPVGRLRSYSAGQNQFRATPTLVICPELPATQGAHTEVAGAYEALANRIANELGWRVVVPMFRGLNGSTGNFSPSGWLNDAGVVIEGEIGSNGALWIAGFGFGAAVAIAVAVDDERVRGVACVGLPVVLGTWSRSPASFEARCRRSGLIEPGFPPDVGLWAAELGMLEPMTLVDRLGERPVLVIHGSEDDDVPPEEARAFSRAAGAGTELRLVFGAGHWLRADPRAVATLIGWLERQS
jgi:uncharacterized protein